MNVQTIARRLLRTTGWDFEGPVPAVAKCVAIAVPHTSNWDGVLMLAAAAAVDLDMSFMIKDDWLRGPMGPIMRKLGAVGIDRSKANNVVDGMIAELRHRDRLWLVIPPEGTRSRTEYWKSGFYHIARAAAVPVGLAFIDWSRREIGFAGFVELTGEEDADMGTIAAAYEGRVGRNPEQQGPVRLRGGG